MPVLAAPVLVALVLGFALWRGSASTAHPLLRFSIDLGPDAISGTNTTVAVSPDGARIVYPVRMAGGGVQLAARLLAESKVTVLAGTEGAADPFFSPDSQWIAFSDGQRMKKVSVHGGAAVTICPLTAALRGASWGADDNIVFSVNFRTTLFVVPAAGGTPRALTSLVGKEVMHRWPQVLPGGRGVLFSAHVRPTGWDEAELQVFDFKTRQTKTVQRAGFFGRYLQAGYLVYLHEGTLFAARFDLEKTQVTGSPVPVVEEVAASRTTGGGQFDFSPAGSFFYLDGKGRDAIPLAWLDRSGKTTELPSIPMLFGLRLSPDGIHLAVSQDENIGIYDLERQTQQRVTSDQQTNRDAVWTADGRRLAYSSQGAWSGIWWARADGSAPPRHLLESRDYLAPQSLTPDGHTLIYLQAERGASGTGVIMTVSLDMSDPDNPKAGTPAPYQTLSGNIVTSADLSPDGRWLAYGSLEPGNHEVIVVPFPGSGQGGKWQVSVGGGRGQRWSRVGKELFYVSRNRQIMVVAYRADGGTFSAAKPRLWSETTLSIGTSFTNRMYDVAPDGKRAVAALEAGQTRAGASLHVSVLLNFFDELKRRIP